MCDIDKLKGMLGRLRDWMKDRRLPPRVTFYILGIASSLWFLIRVIPKPSRASYPCMRVAAPFMSAFVMYLLSLGGISLALREVSRNLRRARYLAAASFAFVAVFGIVFTSIHGSREAAALTILSTGPDDGPNQAMGEAIGINPGRVVWAWDPKATDENCMGYYFNPVYNDQKVISRMFNESVKKLSGETNIRESWDALFRSFNRRKHSVDRGYTQGEKIFIKINQTSGRGSVKLKNREEGNYDVLTSTKLDGPPSRTCETTPYLMLELLRHLVNHCGIEQSDIAIGDPQNPTLGHNYEAWTAEFPDLIFTDRLFGTHGRTLIHATKEDVIFYSDKINSDKLYDVIENADYMINVANFKPHSRAGITLTAKNHFGSQSRVSANHLHYSLVASIISGAPTNSGYRKYRSLVDMMASKYLGRNTLLFMVDGLYGGGSSEGGPPVKYLMAPFNNDWCNSIFISEDQVALESVCYDFLRTEWNGINKHSPTNNRYESMANVNGVDDYLHQAADKSNWPEGIIYDPDKSGYPIPSLGVHEHWNDPERKQYSRNMGMSQGIELVAIPSKITGSRATRMASKRQQADAVPPVKNMSPLPRDTGAGFESEESKFASVEIQPFRKGFTAKEFYSGFIDEDDVKWFQTDEGIAYGRFSFFDRIIEAPGKELAQIAYQTSPAGSKIWFATPRGVIAADMPYSAESSLKLYNTTNSSILGDRIIDITAGANKLQWIGSDQGISGLYNDKWLNPSYDDEYPESFFTYFPITTMAANQAGDSLYVATRGAGVGRFHMNDVDGITGASPYAQWGPCLLPSDSVYSIYINGDTQWYGTDAGLARHDGNDYMTKWTAYTTENGLVNNFVQAIAMDSQGKLWVGTKGGVSVFDGSDWISYNIKDGLVSNNILCIVCDRTGDVYIGTDNGFMVYNNGALICFKQVEKDR